MSCIRRRVPFDLGAPNFHLKTLKSGSSFFRKCSQQYLTLHGQILYLFAGENPHRFAHSSVLYPCTSDKPFVLGPCVTAALLLPSLCPARNNDDVILVAMAHGGASRNMPERKRQEGLLICLGGHAKYTQWNSGGTFYHITKPFYCFCVCGTTFSELD